MEQFNRTINIIGQDGLYKLNKSNVMVVGIGGVGGFAVETLIRSGIGKITIVDNDIVDITNLNRQIIALYENIGHSKVDVMKKRIQNINPNVNVKGLELFITEDNIDMLNIAEYDYVIDAIDTVSSKIALVVEATKYKTPIISSLGTGNKIEPESLKIGDIFETTICPLAKVMRKLLRKASIEQLNVVYSTEEPRKNQDRTPSSMIMVPAVAGILLAKKVIFDIVGE